MCAFLIIKLPTAGFLFNFHTATVGVGKEWTSNILPVSLTECTYLNNPILIKPVQRTKIASNNYHI